MADVSLFLWLMLLYSDLTYKIRGAIFKVYNFWGPCDYRLDLLVEDKVIIELKSVEDLRPVHYKQVMTYLKIAHKRVGLLVNFNVADMAQGIHRIVM